MTKYLHTMIRVSSLEDSIAFFEVLGLHEIRRRPDEEGRYTNVFLAAPGDLCERVLERRGGSRIAVPVERHVGQAAVRRDGRRLSCRALERRHIGRRSSLRVRRNGGIGDVELAHGAPPVNSP